MKIILKGYKNRVYWLTHQVYERYRISKENKTQWNPSGFAEYSAYEPKNFFTSLMIEISIHWQELISGWSNCNIWIQTVMYNAAHR